MEYRGYFNINLHVFDTVLTLLPVSQDYILIDELEKNKIYDVTLHEYVKSIKFDNWDGDTIDLLIKYQNPAIADTFIQSDINTVLANFTHRFLVNFDSIGRFSTSVQSIYEQFENYFNPSVNAIFFYRMKSPKIKLNKELEFVKCESVKYTRPITHRNVTLDVKQSASDEQYNYVYLTVLNRFYFVSDAVLQNDMFVLTLKEDVLMSFKDLILQQNAFIERNEYLYNSNLVDDYVTFDFHKKKEYTKITPTNDFLDFGTGVTPSEKLQYVFITVWGIE